MDLLRVGNFGATASGEAGVSKTALIETPRIARRLGEAANRLRTLRKFTIMSWKQFSFAAGDRDDEPPISDASAKHCLKQF
jgi:hypothetical protein